MGTEIERKFLVKDESWRRQAGPGVLLRQGYLAAGAGLSVRVRTDGDRSWLTIKGPSHGLSRAEFEYAVPQEDTAGLLSLCGPRLVEKRRHRIHFAGHVWEIDEFFGANNGLVVAEVELTRADDPIERPEWLGREVSADPRFSNASLSLSPYSVWGSVS